MGSHANAFHRVPKGGYRPIGGVQRGSGSISAIPGANRRTKALKNLGLIMAANMNQNCIHLLALCFRALPGPGDWDM